MAGNDSGIWTPLCQCMYEVILEFLLVSFSVCGGYHMHANLGT